MIENVPFASRPCAKSRPISAPIGRVDMISAPGSTRPLDEAHLEIDIQRSWILELEIRWLEVLLADRQRLVRGTDGGDRERRRNPCKARPRQPSPRQRRARPSAHRRSA